MQNKIFLILSFLIFTNSIAQINFEKGYFINSSGEKTECLIKNEDWRSNPEFIQYKLSEDDIIKTLSIANTKEFSVYESSKFIRENIDIEYSSLETNKITDKRKLNFENKTLFLRVLTEGKANLYSFRDRSIIKFIAASRKIDELLFIKI